MIERLLDLTIMVNGERDVHLQSVIVHETQSGYAQCFAEDAHSQMMGTIALEDISLSPDILASFHDKELFAKMVEKKDFLNPKTV